MAETILNSPYSIKEAEWINKNEVFPVLLSNLEAVTPEVYFFKEEWLVREITEFLDDKFKVNNVIIKKLENKYYQIYGIYWKRIEEIYYEIDTNK